MNKKILHQIWGGMKRFVPDSLRRVIKEADSRKYSIITNPENLFERVYHIKDESWESCDMPEVWHMNKRYNLSLYHGAQDILCIDNARVFQHSDVVITKQGVVWDKYYSLIYPYTKVLDANVTSVNGEIVSLRKPEQVVYVEGECISLLGACGAVWSHFIMQFLPKLYDAKRAGLLEKNLTILLPDYDDQQINMLVDSVLSHYPHLIKKTVPLKSPIRIEYNCDCLYWIPTSSAISNDFRYPSFYHNVIPNRVINIIREEILNKYVIFPVDRKSWPEKLYLVRKGSYRNLTNIEEVEQYFHDRGFYFVDPSTLSLPEKVQMFNHAKVVAGPHSSAWSNAIFCSNAVGLMLTPITWITDSYLGYAIPMKNCDVIMVPGVENTFGSHNNYYIPISTIDDAYKNLVKNINK